MGTPERPITTIILSAGRSGRFGSPKALIPFDKEHCFLEQIVNEHYHAGIRSIVLVLNTELFLTLRKSALSFPWDLKMKMIINQFPDEGRFSSIKLGVTSADDFPLLFIQNIDNPFTSTKLLEHMIEKAVGVDYVVPVFQGEKGHPVLLTKKIADTIRNHKSNDGNLRDILSAFYCAETEAEDQKILANINTTEEYAKYFKGVKRAAKEAHV